MKAVEPYYKTKNGLFLKIHNHQLEKSKQRGHNLPSYTRQELKDWLFCQIKFHKLYNNWVNSGYKKDLVPSIDRLDDYKGYSFGNIQLTTWVENNKKGQADRKNGVNNKVNRAVEQYDLEGKYITEYHSLMEASRQTNIFVNNIWRVCNNIRKTAGGFIWKYKK